MHMQLLLTPPLAFMVYILLALLFLWVGKKMAGSGSPNAMKSSAYGSGEEAPTNQAAPGYRPFFLVAFFFAILHLGMLVVGSAPLTIISGMFIVGLILALVALILG
jgi:NADH:ubiquinone oxidoreductase subunit 3 (subunit A)